MSFSAVFIICAVLSAVLFLLSLRARRKNIGFTLCALLLLVCDVLSFLIIETRSIKEARNYFFVYYIAYSVLFFAIAWTVLKMSSSKLMKKGVIFMGAFSTVLTLLVLYCFNTSHVIAFSKRILIGRLWWITDIAPDSKGLINFGTYMNLCVVACALIVVLAVICFVDSEKMFRSKFAVIIAFELLHTIMVGITFFLRLPVWIGTLITNPICIYFYYFAFLQADRKVRDVAIMAFANEMSDGLILYNAFNDLIHVNDLIRNTMDRDFLEGIKDVEKLEEWMTHVEHVETIETIPYRNGDREIYFIVRKHRFGTPGKEVGTAYILHDTTNSITQIRLMEKVNSELERTSRMKADFLANMSHELRTPMNAVIGMAQIALREDVMSPRIRDCLNQIDHSGKNLLNIINDILDYSKIDAGKMEILPDRYEPLSEVNDISHILQTRIGKKELELFFLVDPSMPHELVGDCMRIRQVLINIANNAIKFTQEGMIKVTIDCERISEDELELIFHIKDTGQGIKEEDLNKLFVSFQQVDSRRNRNVEGTGLGLAISKRLCEAMGGSIGLSSEYGKGSDFWFRIPQKIASPEPDLVVEDPEKKFIFGYNERKLMVDEFYSEMARLGLECKIIAGFDEYEPTGREDYLLLEEYCYDEALEALLDKYDCLTVVVLTHLGSEFKPSRPNVRVLRRPMSTLAMVLALNGRDISSVLSGSDDEAQVSFTAPEAKILVVDDNAINLSIATGLMEPLKCLCEVAQSGEEAMEMLKSDRYDLILMDHMMPVMDGIETTKAIRESIPLADDTPILALTANVVEGSREMFLQAGMADVIAKPIEVVQLNKKLFEWLPKEKTVVGEAPVKDKASGENGAVLFDCLDCESAIRSLGSETLFRKIVAEYYKRGEKTLYDIESALDNADWPDYSIKTHALKSSSRQIGAMELGDLAEKLEAAGKAEDVQAVEVYHPRAMELLKKLLDDLSKYFTETEEASELPAVTEDELREIFDELERACVNLEMDEMESCAERLKGYSHPEDKKDIMERLYNAIESLDTEECIGAMKEYWLGMTED